MNVRKNINLVSRSIKLFLLLFLIAGAILGGAVMFFYKSEVDLILNSIKIDEANTLVLQKNEISNKLVDIVSDLLFLSRKRDLKDYLDSNDPDILRDIEAEYQVLAFYKKKYDQIRYIDASGQEIIRINYNNAAPLVVEKNALQNKAGRYYFHDAFQLNAGAVFVSPLDLNVENGKIERPFKPVIRIGTPVFDREKRKRGIVLLNYFGQELFDAISQTSAHLEGSAMLLNNQGYWLFNDDAEKEWGFMLPERKAENFAEIYPEEWQQILRQKTGQIETSHGLFTFAMIQLLCSTEISESEHGPVASSPPIAAQLDNCSWVLVAHVSPEILQKHIRPLQRRFSLFGSGLLAFIALLAWFSAVAITKRRLYQSQLLVMALHDPLTSLPNRELFFERLKTGLAYAARNEKRLGVLYIDLDGFKAINDSFGHEAGDELLVQISERMLAIMRRSDTVARIGGDEFAIVLFQINSQEGSLAAGEKILREINKPITLKCGTVSVGASIGAAVYPDSAEKPEELVRSADQAMYLSKQKGKNICTLSEDQNQP